MIIVSNEKLAEHTEGKILKALLNKSVKHLIAYFLLIILSCILFLLNVFTNHTALSVILIIDFFALLLLYDTFRDILSLYKGLKNSSAIKTYTGTLSFKKDRKPLYFINNTQLPSLKASDKSELKEYLGRNLSMHFIDNRLAFVSI